MSGTNEAVDLRTFVSLKDVLEFTVDFGESERQYAERFRRLLWLVDMRHEKRFVNDEAMSHAFPSAGLLGVHECRALLFRPGDVDSEAGLRSALVESGHDGRFLHPLELLALCARYEDVGLASPLLSSPDHVFTDRFGNRHHLLVSRYPGAQAVHFSSPDGIGWSARCLFPIRLP